MALIQALSNEQMQEEESEALATEAAIPVSEQITSSIAGHIRGRYQDFRNARNSEGIDTRIAESLLTYNGQYTSSKAASIKEFGGSEVYSRMTTVKCRGTTAMLRDIFLSNEQPWGLKPTADPETPIDMDEQVDGILAYEISQMIQQGAPPPDPQAIKGRRSQLVEEVKRNVQLQLQEATEHSERKLQDILEEGGFYSALGEFLIDLPIYPFAVIKGPVIRMKETIEWEEGVMVKVKEPKMFWERVDPLNFYYTPGASYIEDADIVEKIKLSRSDVSSLIGVDGYDEPALRGVLTDYDTGLVDWLDTYDTQYSDEQSKENPNINTSHLIDSAEFTGYVKGSMLLDYGVSEDLIEDPDIDYAIKAWLVGRYVIKVVINENPTRLHNYYLSSFEKVPGTIPGHGLPEIINDIQDVANASFRSLVNNMSIASGPQVAVNVDLLTNPTDANSLYPWKRWQFNTDPMGQNTHPPINFFQPQSNASELLGIYQTMATMADEISAIPRYMTGSSNVSGAGSTASGLSMLMNNASKVLQNIAANIDMDIMTPTLQQLYITVMLTDDTAILRGDEQIVVQGVAVAQQRETDRMRQLEFLNMTNNPVDMEIIGLEGRATILGSLANNLGLPGNEIVPNTKEMADKVAEQEAMRQQQMELEKRNQSAGMPPSAPGPKSGGGRVAAPLDNAQRTRSPAAINRQSGG